MDSSPMLMKIKLMTFKVTWRDGCSCLYFVFWKICTSWLHLSSYSSTELGFRDQNNFFFLQYFSSLSLLVYLDKNFIWIKFEFLNMHVLFILNYLIWENNINFPNRCIKRPLWCLDAWRSAKRHLFIWNSLLLMTSMNRMLKTYTFLCLWLYLRFLKR